MSPHSDTYYSDYPSTDVTQDHLTLTPLDFISHSPSAFSVYCGKSFPPLLLQFFSLGQYGGTHVILQEHNICQNQNFQLKLMVAISHFSKNRNWCMAAFGCPWNTPDMPASCQASSCLRWPRFAQPTAQHWLHCRWPQLQPAHLSASAGHTILSLQSIWNLCSLCL